jgi:signal transduction histidine kinase/CheY-like chemotaxis protein
VASVLLAALTWLQLSDRLTAAQQAVALRAEMDQMLNLLLDVETGTRGFVITGNAEFLVPMLLAETRLPRQFDSLAELMKDDPGMLRRVMDLRAKVELSLDDQRKIITIRKNEGFMATKALLGDGQAKKRMDEIRLEVASIHNLRSHIVSDLGDKARSQLWRAFATSLVAGILGLGAGLFAFWLARLTLKHQERERELVEARLLAERNSAEKTVFLANVSHEIRTPMNAILGFSELLGAELTEPKQGHYAKAIRSGAESLLQLIDDVLDISKIEAGAMVLRPEPTDPRELCEFVRTVFAEITTRKRIKLSCHVAEDMPRALLLDRLRLRQILVNLVGNAVKFTEQGSVETRVSFERQLQSSKVTLIFDVQDTGAGIPKEKQDAIFQPFVQGDTNHVREGSGLGLAIVRRLVERMGGTITVASIVGQGSVFHLRLPDIAISPRLPENRKDLADEVVDFNQLIPSTFLIVDDNELNRELMGGMFAGTHHRLVFGCNGRDAVERAREIRPDLVLMDIRMPELDGHAALLKIRQIPGLDLLPVIAVTASNSFEQPPDAVEKFNGFLAKPFTLQRLFDELGHFIPRQSTTIAQPVQMAAEMKPAQREQMFGRLRQMERHEWPLICDSLGVNEVQSFARKLESIGKQFECIPLQNFARLLSGQAEAYAVSEMEKQLLEFPKFLGELEQATQMKGDK